LDRFINVSHPALAQVLEHGITAEAVFRQRFRFGRVERRLIHGQSFPYRKLPFEAASCPNFQKL
jgi:hypothetical protein